MNTIVVQLPLVDTSTSLTLKERIEDLCDVEDAAGYRLAGVTTIQDQLLFIFQRKNL